MTGAATAASPAPAPGPLERGGSGAPWVSIVAVAGILVANLVMDGSCSPAAARWGLGADRLVDGGWWRVASSAAPHVGAVHLVLNLAYLLSVGVFVEPMIGRTRSALALVLGHLGGAAAVLACAPASYVETGASNAIHGFLACGYVVGFMTFRAAALRWTCIAGLAYFAYMTVHAINTGHMPWPVAFFENGGWGHLGGIVTGSALGFVFAGAAGRASTS